MPEWGDKPDEKLNTALHTVLDGLEDEVADNPSFDQVTGIPIDMMTKHAEEAIRAVFGHSPTHDVGDLVQCYAMGFVIGLKYAAYQAQAAQS
jgi:hypothetical protein